MIRRRLLVPLSLLGWLGTVQAASLPNLSYSPSHPEMLRFVVAAAEASPYVSVAAIGQSVRGRQIPVVILHDPNLAPSQLRPVMFIARQHGNEPAGTTALLGVLRDLVEGRLPTLQEQLSRVCVIMVPMVNPDGVAANTRHNAHDADLNRDWVTRRQPETQAVEYLFNLWKPEAVLDLHELHWRDQYGLNTVEAPSEGVLVDGVGDDARALQALILARLRSSGFPVRYSAWNGSSNPGLGHRHFTRDHGVMSLLFESERQGLRTPLPRRAEMHRIGVLTAIEYYERVPNRNQPRLAYNPVIDPTPLRSDARPIAPATIAKRPTLSQSAEPLGPMAPTTDGSIEIAAPNLARPVPQVSRFVITLRGIDRIRYVVARIDGQGRFFSNRAPYGFDARLAAGPHSITVSVHREDGSVVERTESFTVAR